MSLFPQDTELHFPHVFVIPASAGSGKTFTLAYRYVQFILSSHIPANDPRNILAITFTKFAAKEMKERILNVLKEAALEFPDTVQRLSTLLELSSQEIILRSQQIIKTILTNYSDFNIRTIDSFLTTVFKASSLELGVQPDVDISLKNIDIVDRAFQIFSQRMTEKSEEDQFIEDLINRIEANETSSQGFLWNPFSKIADTVRKLNTQFTSHAYDPIAAHYLPELSAVKQTVMKQAKEFLSLLEKLDLPVYKHFKDDIETLASGDILSVAKKSVKEKYFNKFSQKEAAVYEQNESQIIFQAGAIDKNLERYIVLYAKNYYQPFVHASLRIAQIVKEVKILEGTVGLNDINRSLVQYLANGVVPEVYFKLGERIAHFMIDEFQDTSPIQWKILLPLIEESVAKDGSLFAVGDTKQSIYSFRGADWHIFKDLIEGKYFPSAPAKNLPLETNYRSAEHLVNFVKRTFTEKTTEANLQQEAEASGLFNFAQSVPDKEKGKGYIEVKLIENSADDSAHVTEQQNFILSAIRDAHKRGFAYGDIAVLAHTNDEIVEISSWLNNASLPFLSLSTLDIRKRKIIGELLALLRFLDSPIDDLAFATFLFGDIFGKIYCQHAGASLQTAAEVLRTVAEENLKEYLYVSFKKQFPEMWETYFERLFGLVGYMPLYDLASETLKIFSLFTLFPQEESALIKLLECVKQFEQSGNNSLKDFLTFQGDENSDEWSLTIPTGINAVRLMTIHKAKGLGFPVVIIFLREKKSSPDSQMLIPTEEGVSLYYVTKEISKRSSELDGYYKNCKRDQTVDDLNKLYVAFTRAQKEMYIAATYKKRENFPACLLEDEVIGKKYKKVERSSGEEDLQQITPLYKTEHVLLRTSQYEKIGLRETQRGDYIHTIFSHIEFLSNDVAADVQHAMDKLLGESEFDKEKEKEHLLQFFTSPGMRVFFEKGKDRTILREKEFVASNGRLYRMDRVVVDKHEVTVVDFKTGTDEHHEHYQEQVRNYMSLLLELFPTKKIQGMLLYVDMRKVAAV